MRATAASGARSLVVVGTARNEARRTPRRKSFCSTESSAPIMRVLPSWLLLRYIHQLDHRQRDAMNLRATERVSSIDVFVLLADCLLIHLVHVEGDVRSVLCKLALHILLGVALRERLAEL